MLTKSQVTALRDIEITKNICKKAEHHFPPSMDIRQREWIRLTWELYVKSETSFYGLTEAHYRKLLMDETLDEDGHFYFALISVMRSNEKLNPSERVMCRTIVSKNPLHTNMMNNIKKCGYSGDVICFVGPYATKDAATHHLTEHRKTIGKIQLMIEIATRESKTLRWFMIPTNLFSSKDVYTMFLPSTIDGFDRCCGSARSSAASAPSSARSAPSVRPASTSSSAGTST